MKVNLDNKTSPVFSGWHHAVYKNNGNTLTRELAYRNDTSFFRNDLLWDEFVKFLEYKYQDFKKVNVYNYGCSNGSETFSIIMKMLSNLGKENSEKFFPIIAKDIDLAAINKAKSTPLPISWFEKGRINLHTDKKFDTYFTEDSSGYYTKGITPDESFYLPNKILTERVKFSQADIFKDYKNIKPENSIVLARNFWPYLERNIPKLISLLAEQMGKNSTLVIGSFDINGCNNYGINLILELAKKGFKITDNQLIFEKNSQLKYY